MIKSFFNSLVGTSESAETKQVSTVSDSKNPIYQFKLVILGDTFVGKSCLVGRFVKNSFMEFQESTIGAAFMTQTVRLDDCTVKFEIWDTAGQERYRTLAPMYYRGSAAAIIVYDITLKESFNQAKSWIKELKSYVEPNIILALAGNKADLEDQRKVDIDMVQDFASANNCLFMETSAKSGLNVHKLFTEIVPDCNHSIIHYCVNLCGVNRRHHSTDNLILPVHDQAIVTEEERIVCIRFGHDYDPECIKMDELLYKIAEDVKNFCVIYLVDITEVPDFNGMYELYDPVSVMFFYRNKHMMVDLGTGNNNKINWAMNDKQELIDIIETVFRGARKGRGLVISPKDYSTKYRY